MAQEEKRPENIGQPREQSDLMGIIGREARENKGGGLAGGTMKGEKERAQKESGKKAA